MKILKENKGSRLVTYVDEYEGKKYLHIRSQFKKKGMDEFKNTAKGVAIPLNEPDVLKDLYRYMRKVLKENF